MLSAVNLKDSSKAVSKTILKNKVVSTRASMSDEGTPTHSPLIVTDSKTGKLIRRQCVLTCLGAFTLPALPANAFTEAEWSNLVKDGKLTQQAYNVLHNAGTLTDRLAIVLVAHIKRSLTQRSD